MGIFIGPATTGNGGLTGDCDIVNNPCLYLTKIKIIFQSKNVRKDHQIKSSFITSCFRPIVFDILDLRAVDEPCLDG